MYTPATVAHEAFGFTQIRADPAARLGAPAALADLVDDPLLGLSVDGALLIANRAAWRLLDRGETLALRAGRPVPVDESMQGRWRAALGDAHAGRRRLLRTRSAGAARSILLLPGTPDVAPVVVRVGRDTLGRQRMVAAYAQAVGLTVQETRVLEAIVDGESPDDIARRHRVSIATVRTQVRAMTIKAGVAGMRELVADLLRTTG